MITLPRDYSGIKLPYHVEHWKQGYAINMIRPYWDKLPYAFATKINEAYTGDHDLVITKADLDTITDELWNVLKAHL
jgi:hypothetical protein